MKEKRELLSILLSIIAQLYLDDMGAVKVILKMALEKVEEIQSSEKTGEEK